jgi:hypothetical protein
MECKEFVFCEKGLQEGGGVKKFGLRHLWMVSPVIVSG